MTESVFAVAMDDTCGGSSANSNDNDHIYESIDDPSYVSILSKAGGKASPNTENDCSDIPKDV